MENLKILPPEFKNPVLFIQECGSDTILAVGFLAHFHIPKGYSVNVDLYFNKNVDHASIDERLLRGVFENVFCYAYTNTSSCKKPNESFILTMYFDEKCRLNATEVAALWQEQFGVEREELYFRESFVRVMAYRRKISSY